MERVPTRAAKVLKLMECTRQVSTVSIVSCWNKARGTVNMDHTDPEIVLELYEVPSETLAGPSVPETAPENDEEPEKLTIKTFKHTSIFSVPTLKTIKKLFLVSLYVILLQAGLT